MKNILITGGRAAGKTTTLHRETVAMDERLTRVWFADGRNGPPPPALIDWYLGRAHVPVMLDQAEAFMDAGGRAENDDLDDIVVVLDHCEHLVDNPRTCEQLKRIIGDGERPGVHLMMTLGTTDALRKLTGDTLGPNLTVIAQ